MLAGNTQRPHYNTIEIERVRRVLEVPNVEQGGRKNKSDRKNGENRPAPPYNVTWKPL